jgi:hypothetical protein
MAEVSASISNNHLGFLQFLFRMKQKRLNYKALFSGMEGRFDNAPKSKGMAYKRVFELKHRGYLATERTHVFPCSAIISFTEKAIGFFKAVPLLHQFIDFFFPSQEKAFIREEKKEILASPKKKHDLFSFIPSHPPPKKE